MSSKYLKKLVGVGLSALAAVAVIAPAAQASTPAAGYTQFAGCPTKTEKADTSTCLHSVVTGGVFKMGNKEVPIENPIPITGGTNAELGNFGANAEGGLKPVKQKVPGGVIGLTGLTWLLEFLGSEALTLYAVTEAAGLPVFGGFTNITLPIRVHLINGTLGNNCYVGSFTNPIVLHLSTATEGGKEGVFNTDTETGITHIDNSTYVDNTFSAPGASGCVLTLFGFIPISINGLVNSASGLPAASGNKTVQEIDTEIVSVKKVYPPKGF